MLDRIRRLRRRVKQFLGRDVWELSPRKLPPWRALGVRLLRVGLIAGRGFSNDRCGLRASALTYVTLLALVPVLATMFSIARGFHADQHLEGLVLDAIKGIGDEQAIVWLHQSAGQVFDVVRRTPVGALGAIGVALLLYTVVRMMGTIERSFNEIWGVTRPRSFLRKIADYVSTIVVLSILFGAPALATGSLASNAVVGFVTDWIGQNKQTALRAAVFIAPWLGFGFLNMFMPNVKVHWRPALAGAVFGGLLWDLSIIGFVKLGLGVANYNRIYGTFAFAPVALVWLQLNWLIVLLSAELTYAFQNEQTYVLQGDWVQVNHATREALALAVMAPIASHFRAGRPAATPTQLAEQLEAPLRLVNEVLELLAARNIIVATAADDTAYLPARPLERIPVAEILDAVGGYGGEDEPAGELHSRALEIQRRVRRAAHESVRQVTAADLADLAAPE